MGFSLFIRKAHESQNCRLIWMGSVNIIDALFCATGFLYDEERLGNSGRTAGSIKVIGTTLNQRFTLDKELGKGGMGAVYRATDQVLQRTVAIKILKERTDDEVGRKIRLEAQILA